MDNRDQAQTTQDPSEREMWWRRPRSRSAALKLGAAAGAGLGLLDRARPTQAAGDALSGTLTLTWFYAPNYVGSVGKNVYTRYMALHPKVKLVDVAEPSGDLASGGGSVWISTRMLSGHMSDLYEPFSISFILDGVSKGWWVALDPYLDQPNPYVPGNKRWRDLILPGLLDQGKYVDNKTYCFNADAGEWAIFYNKDIFQKVGVQPPATWAELMSISRQLTAAGYGAFGLQGPAYIAGLAIVVESMLWAGAFKHRADEPYFMSPLDFCHAVKSGKLVKNHPRTRQAWQLLKAFSAYWTKGTLTAANDRSFITGKTAMWYTGSYSIGPWLSQTIKNRFEIGVFPIPSVTKESSPLAIGDTYAGIGAMAVGNSLAIPTQALHNGHIGLAIDFLQFYTQPSVVGPLALSQGLTPAIVGTKGLTPLIKQVADEIMTKESLLGPVYFDLNSELTAKEGQLCQGYLAGAIPLDTALNQLDQVQRKAATSALASIGLS
jgi:ABC-type glycerol-3-phosphate transport system substrate-binding protein